MRNSWLKQKQAKEEAEQQEYRRSFQEGAIVSASIIAVVLALLFLTILYLKR